MPKRDRAWRRAQRARIIQARKHRAYTYPEQPLMELWQLHDPEGRPLPVFHRKRDHGASKEDTPVVLYHRRTCREYGGHLQWVYDSGSYTQVWTVPTEDCRCQNITPRWGCRAWSDPSPVIQAGMTWKFLKTYRPCPKTFHTGILDKCHGEEPGHGWDRPKGSDKRWKNITGRSRKVYRAAKLGFVFRGRDPDF